jgi:Icc-related predicted phosphoesterase
MQQAPAAGTCCWRIHDVACTAIASTDYHAKMTTRLRSSQLRSPIEIVCIADTHTLHRELDVPGGDILVHAGDFTMFGRSAAALHDFNEWLGELPHRFKILIPGNHEFFLEADPSQRKLISNATVLIDEGVEVMGLKIWGSPITPMSGGAFGISSAAERTRLYAKIPNGVDILITHGPPQGILDRPPGDFPAAGCPQLLEATRRLKPRLHVFGHVHGAHGMLSVGETLYVNAALLGVDGALSEPAIALRIPRI